MNEPDRFLLAGVMGWPVMHSRSPALHNYWLAKHGLKGSYLPLAIAADVCGRRCGRCRRSAFAAAT